MLLFRYGFAVLVLVLTSQQAFSQTFDQSQRKFSSYFQNGWNLHDPKNYSADIKENAHVLNVFTVPWNGFSRRLMSDIHNLLLQTPASSPLKKLRLRWYNQKYLFASEKATSPSLELVSHGKQLQYRGPLSAAAVLRKVEDVMKTDDHNVPSLLVSTQEELESFFSSSMRNLLLIDECNWNSRYRKKMELLFWGSSNRNFITPGANSKSNSCPLNEGFSYPWADCRSRATRNKSRATNCHHQNVWNQPKKCTPAMWKKFSAFFGSWQRRASNEYFNKENINFAVLTNSSLLALTGQPRSSFKLHCAFSIAAFSPDSARQLSSLCNPNESFWKWAEKLPKSPLQPLDLEALRRVFPGSKPAIVLFTDRDSPDPKVREECQVALREMRRAARHYARESLTGSTGPLSFGPVAVIEREEVRLPAIVTPVTSEAQVQTINLNLVGGEGGQDLGSIVSSLLQSGAVDFGQGDTWQVVIGSNGVEISSSASQLTVEQEEAELSHIRDFRETALRQFADTCQLADHDWLEPEAEEELGLSGHCLFAEQGRNEAMANELQPEMSDSNSNSDSNSDSNGNINSDSGFSEAGMEPDVKSMKVKLYFADGELSLPVQWGHKQASFPCLTLLHPLLNSHYNFPEGLSVTAERIVGFVEAVLERKVPETVLSAPPKPALLVADPSPLLPRSFRRRQAVPAVTSRQFSELVLGKKCSEKRLNYSSVLEPETNPVFTPATEKTLPRRAEAVSSPEADMGDECEQLRGKEMESSNCNLTDALLRDVTVLFTLPSCGFCKRMELAFLEAHRWLLSASSSPFCSLSRHFKCDDGTGSGLSGGSEPIRRIMVNNGSGSGHVDLFPQMYQIDCVQNDCVKINDAGYSINKFPLVLMYPGDEKTNVVSYAGPETVNGVLSFLSMSGSNPFHLPRFSPRIADDFRSRISRKNYPKFKLRHLSQLSQSWLDSSDGGPREPAPEVKPRKPSRQSSKWCRKSGSIEPGTLLIAALDDLPPIFSKAVILILRGPGDGVAGLILNRRVEWDKLPVKKTDVQVFVDSPLGEGGPVRYDSAIPLTPLTRLSNLEGFQKLEAVGLSWGDVARGALQTAATMLVRNEASLSDFWFFAGFSGWAAGQLEAEIQSGAWVLARCSRDVIGWPESLDDVQDESLWYQIVNLLNVS